MDSETLEQKLDQLLELEKMNANNIMVLYQRTTMLAYMMENLSQSREPRVPKIIRAEIDASLDPEAFEALAQRDKEEFLKRYGDIVWQVLQTQGMRAITRIGDFAPEQQEVIN